MSTRELAHFFVDKMDEYQLQTFVNFMDAFMYLEPNAETLEAFAETEDMIKHPEKYKSYTSVEELFKDLESDDDE